MVSILFITAIWALLPDVAAFLSHALLSKSSALLIHLPFSRRMETEADLVGLDLAAKVNLLIVIIWHCLKRIGMELNNSHLHSG